MFKKTLLIAISAFLMIGLVSMGAAAQSTVHMQIASSDNPYINVGQERIPYITYAQLKVFANVAGELSGGRITVEVFGSGVLGDDRTVIEQMQANIIQGVTTNDGVLNNWYPPIQVFSLPFVIDNELVAYEVLDGPFGQKMVEDMAAATGLRLITLGCNSGFRMFANNVRPLVTPDDFAGLRIRTQQIPAQMELVSGQGASPTAVAWSEVYTALQTGVVDGAELPVVASLNQNLQEVIQYITLGKHLYGPVFLVVSEQWYQNLDPELQTAIRLAGEAATYASRGFSAYSTSSVVDYFRTQGIEVTVLNAEEREVLKENSLPAVRSWLVETIGEEWILEFEEAVEEARASLGL